MKICILTQYFPPETGAPQNRLFSLAKNLKESGHEVSVITAMSNYPKMEIFPEYRNKIFCTEEMDGIKVFRSWIFVRKSPSFILRLLNYFSFVITSVLIGLRAPKVDYILCESPPLFLGWSARALCFIKNARLIFNVSDLWPETAEKLGIVQNKWLLKFAYKFEANSYKSAHLVTGQTQGIVRDINRRFPNVRTHWLPNGIDEDVYQFDEVDDSWLDTYALRGKKLFLYAGIVGHAQGLEVIIDAAHKLKDHSEFAFVIIGNGPEKDFLMKRNEQFGAGVVFIPNLPKDTVLRMVGLAYAYIVPLKRLDIFKGAIPSKLFDPLALAVPILLGVEGEAKELFIDTGKAGVAFEPENADALVESVLKISEDEAFRNEAGKAGKEYVTKYFNRKNIARSFVEQL